MIIVIIIFCSGCCYCSFCLHRVCVCGVCTCKFLCLCVCAILLFGRLFITCGIWLLYLCFKQLRHIGCMDDSHSRDVIRQKYMLIWWMCVHCVYMSRIYTRLRFLDDEKNRRSWSERDLEVFRQICCVFSARHEHVFAVNSFFGVELNSFGFSLATDVPFSFSFFSLLLYLSFDSASFFVVAHIWLFIVPFCFSSHKFLASHENKQLFGLLVLLCWWIGCAFFSLQKFMFQIYSIFEYLVSNKWIFKYVYINFIVCRAWFSFSSLFGLIQNRMRVPLWVRIAILYTLVSFWLKEIFSNNFWQKNPRAYCRLCVNLVKPVV